MSAKDSDDDPHLEGYVGVDAGIGPIGTDPDGVQWMRSGDCCRCGECCMGDPSSGELGEAVVEGYCPLFRWLSAGVGDCSDRLHEVYLRGCNVWPSIPQHIEDKPSCTYTFRRVGD